MGHRQREGTGRGAGGGADGAPTESMVRDVLGLIRQPAVSIRGSKVGEDEGADYARGAALCSLWGSLQMWEDELHMCDGEWRRRRADAKHADGASPSSTARGCSAFLRPRRRQGEGQGGKEGRPSVVTGHNAPQGPQDGVRGDAPCGRRLLIAVAGAATVVSFCIHRVDAGGGAGELEEGAESRTSPCAGDSVWAGSTEERWIGREEALWRLGAWMQFMNHK
jgi:hypothetical protein